MPHPGERHIGILLTMNYIASTDTLRYRLREAIRTAKAP